MNGIQSPTATSDQGAGPDGVPVSVGAAVGLGAADTGAVVGAMVAGAAFGATGLHAVSTNASTSVASTNIFFIDHLNQVTNLSIDQLLRAPIDMNQSTLKAVSLQ